jgi:hypothetical protein
MWKGAESVTVGRLTKDGALVGYLAVDTQRWSLSQRHGLTRRRWSEVKRRYRLDLLNDCDEGFLSDEDEADLAAGRFHFKGGICEYEELAGEGGRTVIAQRFSDWA